MKATRLDGMLYLISWLVLSLYSASALALLPTGVGTGGDVVDQFLATTRDSLIQTLRGVADGRDAKDLCECPAGGAPKFACTYLSALTAPQREFCRGFLSATAGQLLALNTGPKRTPFALSYNPLFVADPNGNPRPVIATTKAQAEGEILFHYGSVRTLTPISLLFILAHEFGHKARYSTYGFIDDNSPVGPFDYSGGGRALMDGVGAAVARYAATHKFIGQAFGLEDEFACRVRERRSGLSFSSKGRSPRHFFGASPEFYEAGVGRYPRDFSCELQEKEGVSSLFVRVLVHEELGCRPVEGAGRYTLVEVWRLFDKQGAKSPAPEKLSSQIIPAWNPLCKGLPSEPVKASWSAEQRDYAFDIEYLGSTAVTSADSTWWTGRR